MCQDNSCYAVAGGTSFAAPFVTGGLAAICEVILRDSLEVLKSFQIMFATANKSGVYARFRTIWARPVWT